MPDLTPGLFGKLPSHGDFIDRGLDRSFIGCWDAWLARGLAASRQRLALQWLDLYLVAPIWRFVLSPGICGEGGWQGILMPSVDRVNRHFPLTVALPCRSGQAPLAVLLDDDDWFAHCEAIALEALTTGMDADRLWQGLAQLPATRAAAGCLPVAQARAWHFALPTSAVAAGLGWCLSEALLSQWDEPYSLWSSTGSDQVEPAVLVHRGLPDAEAFTALMSGEFAHHGWHSCRAADYWRPLASAFYPIADGPTDPLTDTPAHDTDDDPVMAVEGDAATESNRDSVVEPGIDAAGEPGIGPGNELGTAPADLLRPPRTNADQGPHAPVPSGRTRQGPDPATMPVTLTPPATPGAPAQDTTTALTDARASTGRVGQDADEHPDGATDA